MRPAALYAWISALGAGLAAQQPGSSPSWLVTMRQGLTGGAPTQPATVALSADGRFLAFESAIPLLPVDTNTSVDVYVLDLRTNALTLGSQAWDGSAADGASAHPSLSADG